MEKRKGTFKQLEVPFLRGPVILSEQSESKDLRTTNAAKQIFSAKILRLHFVPLRMTTMLQNSKVHLPLQHPAGSVVQGININAPIQYGGQDGFVLGHVFCGA